MTEGARRQCRLALTRKNTETHDELQLALFSSNHWSEESRQVNPPLHVDVHQVVAEDHGRRGVRHRGLAQPHLRFRQRERPAAVVSALP